MPKTYQSKSIDSAKLRLTAAELVERNNLALLVRDYESVRMTRGFEHNEAEEALGKALEKHEGPFRHNGHIWQWSRAEQSFLRHKAVKMHPMGKHSR